MLLLASLLGKRTTISSHLKSLHIVHIVQFCRRICFFIQPKKTQPSLLKPNPLPPQKKLNIKPFQLLQTETFEFSSLHRLNGFQPVEVNCCGDGLVGGFTKRSTIFNSQNSFGYYYFKRRDGCSQIFLMLSHEAWIKKHKLFNHINMQLLKFKGIGID